MDFWTIPDRNSSGGYSFPGGIHTYYSQVVIFWTTEKYINIVVTVVVVCIQQHTMIQYSKAVDTGESINDKLEAESYKRVQGRVIWF